MARSGDEYIIVSSADFANRTDDDFLAKGMWHGRHTIGDRIYGRPDLPVSSYPLPHWAPKGTVWRYNRFTNSYRPYRNGRWLGKDDSGVFSRAFW